MKLVFSESILSVLCVYLALCGSCTAAPETKEGPDSKATAGSAKQESTKPKAERQTPNRETASKDAPKSPQVVGKIADYVVTKDELEKRMLAELRPDPYESSTQAEPAAAEMVLKEMVAEKAMMLDARKRGLLQEDRVRQSVERFREKKLIRLLLGRYLQSRLTVTEAEINQELESNPELDRNRARAMVQKAKARRLLDAYYKKLSEKFHVEKVSDNFTKAALIHERLLNHPKEPRKVGWIRNSQVADELTAEEKNMPLATFDGGQVTLEDWFEALCEIVPPRRPKNLHTAEGVERLLDGALRMPVLVAEAELLGLDKIPSFVKEVREYEDKRLLSAVKMAKYKEVEEPNDQEIAAYFEKHKEAFAKPPRLKIDRIWCPDLETAQQAKAALDSGEDFDAVKQKYSLQKEAKPSETYPGSEGIFWQDLWKNDPNEIVGPMKGFYRDGIRWRIVKILEKKPAEPQEYSDELKQRAKWQMVGEKRDAMLAQYRKDLLDEYSYEIYADRLKGVDPLDIP
jgi:hypothetical protein